MHVVLDSGILPERIRFLSQVQRALMLKRAQCTLYLAQESDTLGKDSELASTLAQGKPVIAYVPRIDQSNEEWFLRWLLDTAKRLYPDQDLGQLIMKQLQVFSPEAAWNDRDTKKWINDPQGVD